MPIIMVTNEECFDYYHDENENDLTIDVILCRRTVFDKQKKTFVLVLSDLL